MPKNKPMVINVPEYNFISIGGEGNPNTDSFAEYIGVLYSVAYAIKMNLKKSENPPENYTDWTVYPLEGVWDINEKAKEEYNGTINKEDLVFDLMLRQPDFIDEEYFNEMLELTKIKKPHKLLDQLEYKKITDGKCIQMMHIGSYDTEPESFEIMENFANDQHLSRKSKIHREIYINDFRKVPKEKLKTVLRFKLNV